MNIETPSPAPSQNPSSMAHDLVPAKDRIIEMICNNPDLPTLGSSLSSIVQLSSSDDESTEQLANLILADVSLTQKIIRLSNSVTFRGSSNQIVTNISRAVQLLGLDTIKACASAMVLVEGMPGKHKLYVRKELMLALSASLIGRQLAKRSYFPHAEEVAIAAMFKNMGRILLAACDHDLYKETMNLVKQGTHTQAQASLQTLGCSFDLLTEIAMRTWSIPEPIINAMKLLPAKTLKPPKNRKEWMQQVAEFSESSAQIMYQQEESNENSMEEALLKRFGTALNLDRVELDVLIEQAAQETRALSKQAYMQMPTRTSESGSTKANGTGDNLPVESHPSGKPFNSLEQLSTKTRDVATLIATQNYKINELVLLVLEILYTSLGFNFASMSLKDIKTNQYRARHSLGSNNTELQPHFIFPETEASNIFNLSLKRNVDLTIADSRDAKIQSLLPSWYQQLFPSTRSFVILPLVIEDKPIGFFYLDRHQEAPEGFSPDEMKIIKTLKQLVLTALIS